MFNFNKKEEPIISFVSTVPGLTELEEVLPRKSSEFIPKWWKDMPRISNDEYKAPTAKICPSFTDYFSQGYIVPAWSDFELTYNKESDLWSADFPSSNYYEGKYSWGIHSNNQFLNHADFKFQGQSPSMVFKGDSPWKVITKPGWSVMQLPLFYHFDNPLTALPGIIDTDIMHDLNIQMLYYGEGETIKIKRGEPLAQYIPFKRNKDISFEIREQDENDIKKLQIQEAYLHTKMRNTGAYRRAQKNRDNKL